MTPSRPATHVLAPETWYGLRPHNGSWHDDQLRDPVVVRGADDYQPAQLASVFPMVGTIEANNMDLVDPERMDHRAPITRLDRLSAKQFQGR